MPSIGRLIGTSIDRVNRMDTDIPITKAAARRLDTAYPWYWDEADFPKRAVMTE